MFLRLTKHWLGLLLALAAWPVLAHDFFLLPGEFGAAADGALGVEFFTGHHGEYQRWAHGPHQVAALRSFGPDGVRDQQAGLNNAGAELVLGSAGTYMVVLESYRAASTLSAQQFNSYLAEEGLTTALTVRRANGEMGEPGRELYSRRAKLLVQVGATPTDAVTRPVGLTLEIVPETNPFALEPGAMLPLRVYYRGLPLAGAKVELESISAGLIAPQIRKTDSAGRVTFTVPQAGQWKLNAVWSVPLENHPGGDWDTVFSSLTFGY